MPDSRTSHRNPDLYPQTAMLSVVGQMERLMCHDDYLRELLAVGARVRADSVDTRDGQYERTEGTVLNSCGQDG